MLRRRRCLASQECEESDESRAGQHLRGFEA